jgi:hypothetical protein
MLWWMPWPWAIPPAPRQRRRLDSAGRVPAPKEPGTASAEVPDPGPDQILARRETGEFTYYA